MASLSTGGSYRIGRSKKTRRIEVKGGEGGFAMTLSKPANRTLLLFLSSTLLLYGTGCGASAYRVAEDRQEQVSMGMTRADVLKLLGAPASIQPRIGRTDGTDGWL